MSSVVGGEEKRKGLVVADSQVVGLGECPGGELWAGVEWLFVVGEEEKRRGKEGEWGVVGEAGSVGEEVVMIVERGGGGAQKIGKKK